MLDKNKHYIFRIGSDNQYRLHWDGHRWQYEVLAGGVVFDSRSFPTEDELTNALAEQGMALSLFNVDSDQSGVQYAMDVRQRRMVLEAAGIKPCHKHGFSSMDIQGHCEACVNTDYPDDFKGTEG